jgi:hypothetical protein
MPTTNHTAASAFSPFVRGSVLDNPGANNGWVLAPTTRSRNPEAPLRIEPPLDARDRGAGDIAWSGGGTTRHQAFHDSGPTMPICRRSVTLRVLGSPSPALEPDQPGRYPNHQKGKRSKPSVEMVVPLDEINDNEGEHPTGPKDEQPEALLRSEALLWDRHSNSSSRVRLS